MIECRFDKDMINVIKSTIGTKLLSFELEDDEVNENCCFGSLRINTSVGALNILNEVHEVDYFGEPEDISYFTCEKYDTIVPFEPYCVEAKIKKIMVMEDIISISIVSDRIFIPNMKYEIMFDMAIIIKTKTHTYTISRDWYFMETMQLDIDKPFDEIYSKEKVKEDWNNDGEWEVSVERKITVL